MRFLLFLFYSLILNKHAKVLIFFYLCAVNDNIMEQNTIKKEMWNAASTAGLALGTVSSAYLFATQMIAGSLEPAAIWLQAASVILWIIKFVGCIWLMNFFMRKFAAENPKASGKSVFRMGALTALLSALMYSAVYLANIMYISADWYQNVLETAMQQMSATLDSNSQAMVGKIIDRMPQITFTYNIIYCFIFGTVVSAILSRNITAKGPFEDSKDGQE